MPSYEERASIRLEAEAILNVVCDLARPRTWATWLRVPLAVAARNGNGDLVDKLLKAGADAGAGQMGSNGTSLLHAAAEGGNEGVLSAFLGAEAKSDVNTKTRGTGRTPLNVAVRCGNVAAADALMLAGADANILDAQGNLDAACLLLAWGADENTHDTEGKTPSARIAEIAEPADRPKLERLSKVLLDPKERAWRRRGMLVMCRAHPGRLRLAVEVPNTAEARVRPHRRPRRRARRSQVKVEVTMGGAHHGEEEGAGSRAGTGAGGGGFDALVAWLMVLTEEDVFRTIVEFL
eukprot:g8762.t1